MCNCLKDSEKKISDHLMEKYKFINITDFGYATKAFCIDGKSTVIELSLPFELSHIPLKKDGTKGKERKVTVNIFPSFCPFCGTQKNTY